ncbi:MAG: electron transport complex subunit RsxC [Rhodocyclaceae bacterium]|nr:electron transport complex subunit RsxC [Rhodocyclaceae bacterium]
MGFRDLIADFKLQWGVHPDGHKSLTSERPIESMPLPERLVLPLAQHIGAPARPVVAPGERVLRGQRLAEPVGMVSSAVHAPTSGRIADIGDYPVPHPSGLAAAALVLLPDGLDEPVAFEPCEDPHSLEADEIARRVAAGGVVGLGGATFPAAVKLGLGKRNPVHTLLLNGGECEPYLSCDDRTMRERPQAVVDGARLMARALGAQAVVIGIERNKPAAIAAVQLAASGHPEVSVRALPVRYPMGSEKQLVAYLTGVEVPAGGLSAEVGVVVHNVGTAAEVSRVLRTGEPLTHRALTVSGAAISRPANLRVAIGTSVADIIAHCGGVRRDVARYVMGGPMMGMLLPGTDVPVVKGSSGVLSLTSEEAGGGSASACIRCARCAGVCPIGLQPFEMAARIRAGRAEAAVDLGLKDCIGCGSCAYTCPAKIPLSHYFSYAKGSLAAAERSRLKNESIKKLTAARSERLAREAREKAEAAARRKAEREAAKRRAAEAAAGEAAEERREVPQVSA